MTKKNIMIAEQEALRFLECVKALRERSWNEKVSYVLGSKESAAVRRSSMDLTRSLANLRRW